VKGGEGVSMNVIKSYGGVEFSSTYSWTQHWKEMSLQLFTQSTASLLKDLPISINFLKPSGFFTYHQV
jgi:hypothetical protein